MKLSLSQLTEQVAAILRKDFLIGLRRRATFGYAEREKFFNEIQAAKSEKIILLATNDRAEVEACDEIISLPIN